MARARRLEAALVLYAIASLVLPYALSGDRSLATFVVYVVLAVLSIITSAVCLRRWAELG